jgi:hypothetical protein
LVQQNNTTSTQRNKFSLRYFALLEEEDDLVFIVKGNKKTTKLEVYFGLLPIIITF